MKCRSHLAQPMPGTIAMAGIRTPQMPLPVPEMFVAILTANGYDITDTVPLVGRENIIGPGVGP